MKTVRPYLMMLLALLLGWAIGSFSSDHFYEQWINRYLTRNALGGVSDRLEALKAMRAGDTNQAAALLESQLDSQLIALGTVIQEVPAAKRPAAAIQLITRVRDYRAAHPRKTDSPKTDQRVADILSVTNSSNPP